MTTRSRARRPAAGFGQRDAEPATKPTASPVAAPQMGVRLDAPADGSTATISLMGEIGYDVTVDEVDAALAAAKGVPVTVNIFSYGGDALAGLAIYQMLAAHDAEVTTNVLGVAASAGSVIAMAGDKRVVPANGALMVHNAWSFTVGDAEAHRQSADMLDGVTEAYVRTYSAATGMTAEQVRPYLQQERWIYGEEAASLGFATETGAQMQAFASIAPIPQGRFKSVPDDLKALLGEEKPQAGISVEVCVEVTDPTDPPEPEELEVSGPPDAVIELLGVNSLSPVNPAASGDPAALTMTAENDIKAAAALAERERVAAIRGLAKSHNLPESITDELIDKGTEVSDARARVLEFIGAKQIAAPTSGISDAGCANIGLSPREVESYSFMKVARYLADPNPRTAEAAAFELEASRAAADKHGRSPAGVLIPFDVLSARPQASQTVGDFGKGGALVGTQRLDGSFIELVRNRSAFISSGVTVLNGLQGNVEISKQTGASTYYFVGEEVNVTESDATYGLVNLTPKTIGVRVSLSRRALIQTSPDIEQLTRNDMISQLALGVDYTIGYGSGTSSQPQGIRNVTGIGSVTLGGGASKVYPSNVGGGTHDTGDWADYVDLETAIAANNLEGVRYVMNAVTRGGCRQTLRSSVAGADYIYKDDGTIAGYPVTVSNQIQTNDVFFGDFSSLLVGFWSGLDVTVDPFTQSAKGQVILTVHQDFDVAVRRAEAFALGT